MGWAKSGDGHAYLGCAVFDGIFGVHPVAYKQVVFALVKGLGIGANGDTDIGEISQDGVNIQESGGSQARGLGHLFYTLLTIHQHLCPCISALRRCAITNLKDSQEFWIVDISRAETVDHLRGQRVCIASDMVEKSVWRVEEIDEHALVFENLVWDVGFGRVDMEDVVHHLSNHAPCGTIFLAGVSWRMEQGRKIKH